MRPKLPSATGRIPFTDIEGSTKLLQSGVPVNVGWVIRLLGQGSGRVHVITDDIRDELIHLERSAEHWN